jgi:hypothetical protein
MHQVLLLICAHQLPLICTMGLPLEFELGSIDGIDKNCISVSGNTYSIYQPKNAFGAQAHWSPLF